MPRKLTREETIECLLESLREAQQAPGASASAGESSDRPLQHNPLYHAGTYAELERCLESMVRAPGYFQGSPIARLRPHVTGFYCAPTRIRRSTIKRTVGQSTETIEIQEVIRAPSRHVRPELARRGVSYISSIFKGEPFLPDEIWRVVAA